MQRYDDASIVVIGKFNPAIFQPEWFRRHEILPEYELERLSDDKNGLLVHNDVTFLNFKSLSLHVQRERWMLVTERADWIGDLGGVAASILEKLRETPVTTVGLNINQHRIPIEGKEALLTRWAPLGPLGLLVGTEPQPAGTVRAQWDGFSATLSVDSSIKQKGAVFIGQNFERAVATVVPDLTDLLRLTWPKLVTRANSLAEQILATPLKNHE